MKKTIFLWTIFWIGFSGICSAQQKESLAVNADILCFSRLVELYSAGSNQKLPTNWSQIWDSDRLAHSSISAPEEPMIYRRISFVESSSATDPSQSRVLAISRGTIERSWKDKNGDPVQQRIVFSISPKDKVGVSLVDANKPFGKIDLDKLALKEPDPSPKQLADTIKVMFDLGYNANQIYAALGNDDIEAVKKSGALDPAFQRMLDEKPPQLASTPTLAASTPRPSATATPAVVTEKSSSGFPIVPVVILAAVIAGATVFFLRRKNP